MINTVNVNGIEYAVQEEHYEKKLLQWLREILGLTGAKCGCGTGHCGSCNVLIDGKAKRACLFKMEKLFGKKIVTIEGLAKDGVLHPVQESFIKCGVMQCGYCTPAQIITIVGLLNENPEPTRADIDKAFRGILCRCGSYPRVLKAIERSVAIMHRRKWEDYSDGNEIDEIGKSHPMHDAVEKVTGKLKFTDDYIFDNMLYGKFAFSEYPSAELLDIDVSEAEEMPGVRLILTHKNINNILVGPIIADTPVLAKDRIRSLADPIAAVFADSQEQVDAAVHAIKGKYKVLPAVFTTKDALDSNAFKIHREGNIAKETSIYRGNVSKAFKEAYVVLEGDYSTSRIEHAYIETECSVAKPNNLGGVDLYTVTQSPFHEQEGVAEYLGLKKEQVKVTQAPDGGSFGGKGEGMPPLLAAQAAIMTGRPVKIFMDRKDSLRWHFKRHPFDMHYKVGATKEGKLLGMEVDMAADGGAYMSYSWRVIPQSVSYCTGPYMVPTLSASGKAMYTNNITCGAMRGYGVPQCTFAVESIMDQLAIKLNIDPITIRRINGLQSGLIAATGQIIPKGHAYLQTLDIIDEKIKNELLPLKEKYENIGIGVASGWRHISGGLGPREYTSVGLELIPGGKVLLKVACAEMGNESQIGLAQIAAQRMELPFDRFEFCPMETDKVPWGGAVMASRGTFLWGHATLDAAEKFIKTALEEVAAMLDIKGEILEFRNGKFWRESSPNEICTLEELETYLRNSGRKLDVVGEVLLPRTYDPLKDTNESKEMSDKEYKTHHTNSYITVAVAIQADKVNKKIKVLKAIAALDIGTILNPEAARRQVEGGIIMGLGSAISEDFEVKDGVNQIDMLAKYKIPDMAMVPDIDVIFVDNHDPAGPLGAKGVGEIGILPIPPAITNAWYDATGDRVTKIPLLKNI